MSDTVAFGIRFSLMGIGIVFGVLLLVTCAVAVMQLLDRAHARPAPTPGKQNIDDLTLALIAAAAAVMVTGRARIRSIRRVLQADSPRSPWSMQGRALLLGSHQIFKKGRQR
jgi:Na+-transporting methylmalonyl-CoA/oxaloacetate decarboxylase gamma subunit